MADVMIVGDSLAARITAILLGSVLALSLLLAVVMLWPRGGPDSEGLFKLPVPEETVAIVEALEASPPAARPLVLKAINTNVASVRIDPTFSPIPPGLRRAREMEWMFGRYSRLLGGRPFRVDMRDGPLAGLAPWNANRARASVRLSVGLRDGSVLVIERRPSAMMRAYIARAAAIAATGAIIVIGGLVLAIRQTARPVARLAAAARRFSIDGAAPDLPLSGPRELQDLSAAFNELQHRIKGLVEDRTRGLAAVAHDLRTYLTRLRLRVEFIVEEDQQARATQDIEEMALLIDDTLLFAQQGSLRDKTDCLNIVTALRSFVAIRQETGERLMFDTKGVEADTLVRCSAITLQRMIANLVDNAIRYGGSARIELHRMDSQVQIAVLDDGGGVPSKDIQRLMKPFERMEQSRGRETGGAGLGLSIVKALAESCGGTFELSNREPAGMQAVIALHLAERPDLPVVMFSTT